MRRIARMMMTVVAAAGLSTPVAIGQGQAPPARRAPARQGAAPAAARNPQGPMDAKVPAQPAIDPAEMDRLLVNWEEFSSKLTSLYVGFSRVDSAVAWGEEKFRGQAFLKEPNLACLQFDKLPSGQPAKPGVAPKTEPFERIVCTGQDVRQYNYAVKKIFVFPLDKQERKKAVQQGPLPFLFNLKAAEARQRYEMELRAQNEAAWLIRVVPRLADDQAVFSKALLTLNKKTYLPDRLILIDPNGKDTQDYRFSDVQTNVAIEPKFFAAANIPGWEVVVNPGGDPPAQAPRGAVEPAVGARPRAEGRGVPRPRTNQ